MTKHIQQTATTIRRIKGRDTKTKTTIKNNKSQNKNTKKYPSTTRNLAIQPTLLTLEILNDIVLRELPQLKDIDVDEMTAKIAGIKTTELGKSQQQNKTTGKYIKSIVSALIPTFAAQNNNLRSKKIPEFIPPNSNYKDDVCITSKYNLKKLETSGRGAFGQVYKFKSGTKTLAVKVVDISRANENSFMKCWGGWSHLYTVEQMEKEATISKHLGELGIGPKIYDVFYCMSTSQTGKKKNKNKKVAKSQAKNDEENNDEENNDKENNDEEKTQENNEGKIKYYYVMDYMNRGSLNDYMEANNLKVLPDKYVKQIITKLEKMHAAGYIHDDLHTGNILVNEPKKGQLEFYISDFGLSNKLTAKLEDETKNLYDTLKYDGNRYKKTLELQLDYFTKLILNQYSVPAPTVNN